MIEAAKARAWRERNDLTRDELSALTGYSKESIYWMERGEMPHRGTQVPVSTAAWTRYRNACAGVAWKLERDRDFKWE